MRNIIFFFTALLVIGCAEKVTKSQNERIIKNNSEHLVSLQFFIGDQLVEEFTLESGDSIVLTEECLIEGGDITGCTMKWTNGDLIQPQKSHIIFDQEKIIKYERFPGICSEGDKNILSSIPFQVLNPGYPAVNCGYMVTDDANTYLFEITEQDYEEAEPL